MCFDSKELRLAAPTLRSVTFPRSTNGLRYEGVVADWLRQPPPNFPVKMNYNIYEEDGIENQFHCVKHITLKL